MGARLRQDGAVTGNVDAPMKQWLIAR